MYKHYKTISKKLFVEHYVRQNMKSKHKNAFLVEVSKRKMKVKLKV